MFTRLDYSSALEYSIIRRYTNIVYYYYYYIITQISREYDLEINSEKSWVMIFNVKEEPEHLCNIKVVQKMDNLE